MEHLGNKKREKDSFLFICSGEVGKKAGNHNQNQRRFSYFSEKVNKALNIYPAAQTICIYALWKSVRCSVKMKKLKSCEVFWQQQFSFPFTFFHVFQPAYWKTSLLDFMYSPGQLWLRHVFTTLSRACSFGLVVFFCKSHWFYSDTDWGGDPDSQWCQTCPYFHEAVSGNAEFRRVPLLLPKYKQCCSSLHGSPAVPSQQGHLPCQYVMLQCLSTSLNSHLPLLWVLHRQDGRGMQYLLWGISAVVSLAKLCYVPALLETMGSSYL